MRLNSQFHLTHLETEVRLWTHSCDFPNGKYNRSNNDTHHQDACWTGVQCHSPHRKWGARMLTCINILYMIQITWQNDRVNDLINRKRMTQLMHQKCFKADSDFHILHHSQGRVVPTTGFPGRYSVPLYDFTLYSHGFLSFFLLASPWSEAKGGECSDPHQPRGDHVCIYYI